MGLGNKGGKKNYLNIKEGKIIMKVGDTYEPFDHISGMITNVGTHEGRFGKELHITIQDDADEFLLQVKFDSGYSRGFLMAIKNADLSLPVVLVPKYEEKDSKKKSTLFINQNGKGVRWAWVKDNPGDLPPMKQVTLKGEKVWDNTDEMNYLEKMLLEEIKPKLSAVVPAVVESNGDDAPDSEDDLPF